MNFLYALDPRYVLPNRETVKFNLKEEYKSKHAIVKNMLSECPKINLTTDIWTSIAMDPYLGITCHTVAPNGKMFSFLLYISHFPHPHDGILIKKEFEEVILILYFNNLNFLFNIVSQNLNMIKTGLG